MFSKQSCLGASVSTQLAITQAVHHRHVCCHAKPSLFGLCMIARSSYLRRCCAQLLQQSRVPFEGQADTHQEEQAEQSCSLMGLCTSIP